MVKKYQPDHTWQFQTMYFIFVFITNKTIILEKIRHLYVTSNRFHDYELHNDILLLDASVKASVSTSLGFLL